MVTERLQICLLEDYIRDKKSILILILITRRIKVYSIKIMLNRMCSNTDWAIVWGALAGFRNSPIISFWKTFHFERHKICTVHDKNTLLTFLCFKLVTNFNRFVGIFTSAFVCLEDLQMLSIQQTNVQLFSTVASYTLLFIVTYNQHKMKHWSS